MSEPTVPPPPQYTPPPPPATPGGASANRGLMLVLAYLGPLAVIPLVTEKEDSEVQWHAKHGLVLFVAELVICVALFILFHVIPFMVCLGVFFLPIFWLAVLVVHIICIIKANNGQRFKLPVLSDYADRF